MRVPALLAYLAIAVLVTACQSLEPTLSQKLSMVVTPPFGTRYADTGTAFFVAPDGVLLTASHVVRGCIRIDVLSETMAATTASTIAEERTLDLALLRIEGGARAPAVLSMASTLPNVAEAVKLYGYPGSADLRRAAVIDAKLATDRAPPKYHAAIANPPTLVWLDGPAEHGYSGGPVVDKDGAVIGVARIVLTDPAYAGIFIAMGARAVTAVEGKVQLTASAEPAPKDESTVRSAIVRLVCWRENSTSLGDD